MKTTIKHYTLAALLGTMGVMAQAQEFNSAYFIHGMSARHELNPAFGNEENYVSIPALGSLNVKMQGNFGLQDILFLNPNNGKYDRTFMHPDVSVSEALSGLSTGMNKVSADVSITLLSAGFKAFGGYNTIELKARANAGLKAPYELFEFAKDMNNRDYQFDEIRAKARGYAELAFGHSRQLTDELRIGGKFKLLFGIANADLTIENLRATLVGDTWELSSDKAEGNVNMKGIQFKNKMKDYKFSSGSYEYVDFGKTDVKGAGISGFGVGIDLGAEYQLIENLKISAAIKDLGFISWNNNYLLKQRAATFSFDGFHDVAIKNKETQHGEVLDDKFDSYSDQFSNFVALQNQGDTGGRTTALAATINLAGEYTLPMYNPLTVGLLLQQRLNGPLSWTEGRLSANWNPLAWLNGGMNFAISTFSASAGWIINIHPKGYNFFIGMDHVIGKMSKQFIPLSSNASISIGMAVTWGGGKTEKVRREVLTTEPEPAYQAF